MMLRTKVLTFCLCLLTTLHVCAISAAPATDTKTPAKPSPAKKDPDMLQNLDKKYNIAPENGFEALWNADGSIDNPANLKTLPFHPQRKYYALFKDDKAYYPLNSSMRISEGQCKLGQYADQDPQKVTRYAVYQFTMPADAVGNVWLFNGNFVLFASENAEAELLLSVNGKTVRTVLIKGIPRVPVQFEQDLGQLKKGDVIRIAVGPKNAEASNQAYRLMYGYKILPGGASPEKNVNLILPPADQPVPPLQINGEVQLSYKWSTYVHNQELKKEEPQLILLGDSITAAWRWGKGPCYSKTGTLDGGYDVAADKLKKYKALGMGLSGDWTNNLLWRLNEYQFSEKNPPKLVTVMIGTNNLGNGHTPEQVVAAQKVIHAKIREKLPNAKILWLAITPRGGVTTDNPLYKDAQKVNVETAKFADGKTVFYLDLGNVLAPGGKIDTKVFYDQLHLTHYGLNLWADAMIPVLDQMLKTK